MNTDGEDLNQEGKSPDCRLQRGQGDVIGNWRFEISKGIDAGPPVRGAALADAVFSGLAGRSSPTTFWAGKAGRMRARFVRSKQDMTGHFSNCGFGPAR